MREILFRAKRKDVGEWVEGYLFDDGMAEVEHYFVGRIVIEPRTAIGYGRMILFPSTLTIIWSRKKISLDRLCIWKDGLVGA